MQQKKNNDAGASFTPGAYWELVKQDGDVVQDTTFVNGEVFHGPTQPEGEIEIVKKKLLTYIRSSTFYWYHKASKNMGQSYCKK